MLYHLLEVNQTGTDGLSIVLATNLLFRTVAGIASLKPELDEDNSQTIDIGLWSQKRDQFWRCTFRGAGQVGNPDKSVYYEKTTLKEPFMLQNVKVR